MYQEDYLLRMVHDLVAAVAKLAPGDVVSHPFEIDELLGRAFGMSLTTLDRIPANRLVGLLVPADPLAALRVEALAALLDALAARGGPEAAGRAAKAEALRQAIAASEERDLP